MQLTIRAIGHSGEGPGLTTNRRPFQYEVDGLPEGQRATIAEFNGGRWRTLRTISGEQGDWEGDHATAEDALAALGLQLADKPPAL